MIAVDTNIIVRLIVRDDEAQVAAARELLDTNELFVSFGVLMECAWVLRSQYGMKRAEVNGALLSMIRLTSIHLADRDGVRWALARHAAGADFPDVLHLLDTSNAEAFATFDNSLEREAGPETPLPIKLI